MSPAALKEAHRRHHRALIVAHGDGSGRGVRVTIGSRTYDAAVLRDPLRHAPAEDGSGWEKVQNITLSILKTHMPTQPAERTAATIDGVTYLITQIDGQEAVNQAWMISAQRRSPAPS